MTNLNLGKKLKAYRQLNNMTIRDLANKTSITSSMLSQIEHGTVNPSINTLRVIAAALDTPLYDFFKEELEGKVIVHSSERKIIGTKSGSEVSYELLTPDTKGNIEFCMMEIPPGVDSANEMRNHSGEEVAYMQSGKEVELEVEGKIYKLRPGDSIRIPPLSRHVWHNRADVTVNVIFAVTPPTF